MRSSNSDWVSLPSAKPARSTSIALSRSAFEASMEPGLGLYATIRASPVDVLTECRRARPARSCQSVTQARLLPAGNAACRPSRPGEGNEGHRHHEQAERDGQIAEHEAGHGQAVTLLAAPPDLAAGDVPADDRRDGGRARGDE